MASPSLRCAVNAEYTPDFEDIGKNIKIFILIVVAIRYDNMLIY